MRRVSSSVLFSLPDPRTYVINSCPTLIPGKHFVSVDAYIVKKTKFRHPNMLSDMLQKG